MSRPHNYKRPPELTHKQIIDRVLDKVGIRVGRTAIRLDLHIDELLTDKKGIKKGTSDKLGITRPHEWPPPKGWKKALSNNEVWIERDAFRIALGYR